MQMDDDQEIDGYTTGLFLVAAFLAWIDAFLLLTRYGGMADPDLIMRSFQ
jgi:hypothetical protein